ncbi:hypothetical protein HHI36_001032 [Cryptolaemus montrouzieri]|uniref:G-patch domain-containing protein n=1 Tax=Cryptolaemus montrouzieri TaxID=559131 RepID=A0ABD2P719_9CUCU
MVGLKMNSENKKISFGFSKLSKKSNVPLQTPKTTKAVELIDYLEGSEIKVKKHSYGFSAVEKIERGPLIIPIKGSSNTLTDRIEKETLKNKNLKIEKEDTEDTRPDSELSIEDLAARQLLREARNRLTQEKNTSKIHTLPLVDEKVILDGEEPSIEDYESVPIGDYGLAMLRGMGWKEGMCIGKNQTYVKPPEPELRPKGLGLGAQKIVDTDQQDVFDKNGKKLLLTSGAFGKIIAGSHKGLFCEIQGLDDESGRIIVKTNKSGQILTLNELFVKPVSKDDYMLGSKVLNNAKYEEYKEQEMKSETSSKNRSSPVLEDEKCRSSSNTSYPKKEKGEVHGNAMSNQQNKMLGLDPSTLIKEKKHHRNSSKDDYERRKYKDKSKKRDESRSTSRRDSSRNKNRRYSYSTSSSEDKSSTEETSSSAEDRHQSRSGKSKKA